jgi:hypothetical protein
MMWMDRRWAGLVMALALLVPGMTPVNAQTAQLQAGEEYPWSRNVPKKNQDAADGLLQTGNDLMKKSAYAKAEVKYLEALAQWDHPGIHYNLALALLQLNRPAEVYAHLVKALEGGEAALGLEKYEHARIHKEALEKQLAWVEFVCENPNAVVTVGGQPLPLVNGRYEGLMRPGPVLFGGAEEGYQPREKKFDLSPGQKNSLRFKLYRSDELITYDSRWAPWKPWAVAGAGAALAAGGGLLYWRARHGYSSFDAHVVDCGKGVNDRGCREPELAARRSRLQTLNKASIGTMAIGGAALVTGASLVLFNRAQAHPIDPDEFERRQGLAVTPVLGRGANGVLVTLQY